MCAKRSYTWLKEHFTDEYVKQAQKDGYRSRAVYKLQELHARDFLFKPGMTVIDLGAAPGGWSQWISKQLGRKGRVIALDILPMDPLPQVEFIQGDFSEEATLEKLQALLGQTKVDWVISDMLPNMSGIASVDQSRSMYLCELALDFALNTLPKGGGFLIKVFQGEGFEEFLKILRREFENVSIRKPKASRGRSKEIYLVATGRK